MPPKTPWPIVSATQAFWVDADNSPRLPEPPREWKKQYKAAKEDYYHEVTGLRWPKGK